MFQTFNDQGTKFEFTVFQTFNQGSIPKKGVIFSGLFFGYFFEKQKVTEINFK
jgi:hypothetical protein